jgi:hypothetical protein
MLGHNHALKLAWTICVRLDIHGIIKSKHTSAG